MIASALPEPTQTLVDRFLAKVDASGDPDRCWLWTGGVQTRGYGSFGFGPRGQVRTFLAHRLAYHWFVAPLDPALTVDHRCFMKRCVRPDHLEAVSLEVNAARGQFRRGGRSAPAVAARLLVLHERRVELERFAAQGVKHDPQPHVEAVS